MALTNANFDGILSAVVGLWIGDKFADAITGHNEFFAFLKEQERVTTEGLGTKIVRAFRFPGTSGPAAAGVSDSYADLTHAAMQGLTGAEYTPAQYAMPVSVEEYDLEKQGSKTKKMNWVQAVIDQGFDIFNETLNADLWGAESGTSSAGARTKLASIRTLLNAGKGTTSSAGTPAALTEQIGNRAVSNADTVDAMTLVGGIQRNATNAAYWCTPVILSADTLNIQVLSSIYSKGVRGKNKPKLIVVHRNSFDKLMSLASLGGANGGQMFSQSKMADMGFEALRFRNAEIITDDGVPTASYLNNASTAYGYNIFMINTDFLELVTSSMKPKVKEVVDRRALKTWTVTWYGQLAASNLGRVHVRHANITN